ncbi:hypothetical protein [Pseudalkalibacillus berkeleyi]|uniref:Uncharacterized protein n=1 Tax=Pseudalkalibacillus berkeleyi TaxID=1069813 RepID=A0ABS9GUS3_9BACL|nr:hypothetical protein [Pseudalkalibacillus berkeleyi]MCF6136434.1 hypothetical protein [Pseudalkalibacillus berkeleyi]
MNDFVNEQKCYYSTILHHCQIAILLEYENHQKFPNVKRICALTGYTEEKILESLEFGQSDSQLHRFRHTKRIIRYQ